MNENEVHIVDPIEFVISANIVSGIFEHLNAALACLQVRIEFVVDIFGRVNIRQCFSPDSNSLRPVFHRRGSPNEHPASSQMASSQEIIISYHNDNTLDAILQSFIPALSPVIH